MVAGVDRGSVPFFRSHLLASVDCLPLVVLAVERPLAVERLSFGLSNNLIDIMACRGDGVATVLSCARLLVGPLCKASQYFAVVVSVRAELFCQLLPLLLAGVIVGILESFDETTIQLHSVAALLFRGGRADEFVEMFEDLAVLADVTSVLDIISFAGARFLR